MLLRKPIWFKLTLLLICGALLLVGCAHKPRTSAHSLEMGSLENGASNNNTIVIKNQEETYRVETKDGLIPVLSTLSMFVYDFRWDGSDYAHFRIDEKAYVVSIANHFIGEEGSEYNMLREVPGSEYYQVVFEDSEIYVDVDTMDGLFFELNLPARAFNQTNY